MFVLISMITGCDTLQEMFVSSQNVYFKTDTVEGVIFNASILNPETTKYYIYDENNRNPDSYWTPTQDDVLVLESNLPAYLKSKLPANHYAYGLWDKLPEYKRQYIGYIIDGEKRIFANYFCSLAAVQSSVWLQSLRYRNSGRNGASAIRRSPIIPRVGGYSWWVFFSLGSWPTAVLMKAMFLSPYASQYSAWLR